MSSTPAFKIIKYIADLTDLQDLHNDHFGLSVGDDGYWEDFASSPIYPVSEQPESDKFYITYNFADDFDFGTWWHLDTSMVLYVFVNDLMLISDVTDTLRSELSDVNYAADRINQWGVDNNIEGPMINWTTYLGAEAIAPQEQENGVYGRSIELLVNSTVC